jgi:predicted lactoylglutathione lyase
MSTKIFVNLPVKNLQRTMAFFKALGFEFNPQFTNDQGASMVVNEHIYVMHLLEGFFQTFTTKPVADATRSTEVLVCLSCDSREQVDEYVSRALQAGGKAPRPPQDHGFMYSHGFEDLDGHMWEVVYMAGMPPQA